MKLTESAEGVFIISATPFTESGEIDYASADRLVEFYIEQKVSGMTILGMMGEAPKLSSEESLAFMQYMLKRVDSRVPVIVGVSNAGIANIAALSHQAMAQGAAGVMIAPAGGLGTDEKLYAYFEQCFEALGPDVPVCYQDFPLSTGVHLSADLFTRMVVDFDQLVMLKHEDWPGLNKLSKVLCSDRRSSGLNSVWQRWHISAGRNRSRCRWRDDRLCFSRDAGRCCRSLSRRKL